MQQALRITVSTRQGSTEQPLLPLLEKASESLLRQSEIDQNN